MLNRRRIKTFHRETPCETETAGHAYIAAWQTTNIYRDSEAASTFTAILRGRRTLWKAATPCAEYATARFPAGGHTRDGLRP